MTPGVSARGVLTEGKFGTLAPRACTACTAALLLLVQPLVLQARLCHPSHEPKDATACGIQTTNWRVMGKQTRTSRHKLAGKATMINSEQQSGAGSAAYLHTRSKYTVLKFADTRGKKSKNNLPNFAGDVSDLELEAVAKLQAPVRRHRLGRLACGCYRHRSRQRSPPSLLVYVCVQQTAGRSRVNQRQAGEGEKKNNQDRRPNGQRSETEGASCACLLVCACVKLAVRRGVRVQ